MVDIEMKLDKKRQKARGKKEIKSKYSSDVSESRLTAFFFRSSIFFSFFFKFVTSFFFDTNGPQDFFPPFFLCTISLPVGRSS